MESMEFQEEDNSSNLHSRTDNSQAHTILEVHEGEAQEASEIPEEGNSSNQDSNIEDSQSQEGDYFSNQDSSTEDSQSEEGDYSSNQDSSTEDSQSEEGEEKTREGTSYNVKTAVSRLQSWLQEPSRPTKREICSTDRTIYRVTKALRLVNVKAYTPFLIGLGLLCPGERRSLVYMQCNRAFLSESEGTLQSYIELVERNASIIRRCYANDIHRFFCHEGMLIESVLIDSVFIIQLLKSVSCSVPRDNCMSSFAVERIQLERDLTLAENQLPFFILCDLYRAAFNPARNANVPSFTDIACRFFRISKNGIPIDHETNEATCCHLLDMLRMHYLPPNVERRRKADFEIVVESALEEKGERGKEKEASYKTKFRGEKMIEIMSPSATSLHQAGVKLVADENNEYLLDIKFNEKKGILTIPKLRLDNRMEVLIMNLVAFEQWHCRHNDAYWTYYRRFMDFLVKTPEDVKLLVEAGIIENLLGSDDDVCSLFNTSAKVGEFYLDHYYYADISLRLNRYCKRTYNRTRAILKQMCFNDPWATIFVIYAVVLLLSMIGQFVTGVISLLQK